MRGLYVTGTDTDVGKTRVCAALARGWLEARPTIVKLVQTGLTPDAEGDAAIAGRLAGCAWRELARLPAPADPWSAALAADRPPLTAGPLVDALRTCSEPIVAEGSGGAAVPLNAAESISDVAARAGLTAVVVVGLRLGCINHALLTVEYLRARSVAVAGAVLVERWQPTTAAYGADVRRALASHLPILGTLPYAPHAEVPPDPLFTPIPTETPAFIPQS